MAVWARGAPTARGVLGCLSCVCEVSGQRGKGTGSSTPCSGDKAEGAGVRLGRVYQPRAALVSHGTSPCASGRCRGGAGGGAGPGAVPMPGGGGAGPGEAGAVLGL